MTKTKTELKACPVPCPFCGAIPEPIKVTSWQKPQWKIIHSVGCLLRGVVDFLWEDENLDEWNRRASPSPVKELVEALERIAAMTEPYDGLGDLPVDLSAIVKIARDALAQAQRKEAK